MTISGQDDPVDSRLAKRHASHTLISAELEALTNADLTAILADAVPLGSGIGGARALVDIGGAPVFVKRVPLTDIERLTANAESTRDMFDMPSGCQYGVGSPGFGVWREVAANVIATQLAMSRTLGCFAAMYHWRMLDGPASNGPLCEELADIDEFVGHWHGSTGVRRRAEGIAEATAHVALFLEYIPTTLPQWLSEQIGKGEGIASAAIDLVEKCLLRDVPAMNAAGLFHFDAHFDNMLTDGEQIYLADFGLATSPSFDLSQSEREFLRRNATHDVAHTITRLVDWLVFEFVAPASLTDRDGLIERIAATSRVSVPMNASARRVIERYAGVAAVINGFYAQLHGGDRTTEYPTVAILEACNDAGLKTSNIDLR